MSIVYLWRVYTFKGGNVHITHGHTHIRIAYSIHCITQRYAMHGTGRDSRRFV